MLRKVFTKKSVFYGIGIVNSMVSSACLSKFHKKPCYYLSIIYIKMFEAIVVLTYGYSEPSTGKVFLAALLYHIIQR
jgi:hypothetical protein